MGRFKRFWYLSAMRAAKVQASLRIRAVLPEPPLLAHTSSESRGTFRQKARSLAPLNGWACAVKVCHDGMLEDTNSLDAAHMNVINECILVLLVFICDQKPHLISRCQSSKKKKKCKNKKNVRLASNVMYLSFYSTFYAVFFFLNSGCCC